jgi:hypothetical protein
LVAMVSVIDSAGMLMTPVPRSTLTSKLACARLGIR